MTTRQIVASLATLAWLLAPLAHAQDDVPPGITEPLVLAPFVPVEALCSAPPGLQHSLAFVQDNRREFMEGVGFGLSRAAADRGLAYSNLLASDDAALMIEQIDAL